MDHPTEARSLIWTNGGGSPYYPAFAYAFYGHPSDQDIADLWAAVRGVPAQEVTVGTSDLGFPFNLRASKYLGRAIWRKWSGYANACDGSTDLLRGKSDRASSRS